MTNNHPILYAEDDENDVFLMQRTFKKVGISNPLQIVTDGNQAIEYLSGFGAYSDRGVYPMPCLVLLDLKMPGKSGFEVLKWLRSHLPTSTLPALVLTSSNQESDIQNAQSLGANGYFIKPGKPEELLVLVKNLKDLWLTKDRTPPAWVAP